MNITPNMPDAKLVKFTTAFLANTVGNEAAYGLTPDMTALLAARLADFSDAIDATGDPVRAAPAAFDRKRIVKGQLVETVRTIIAVCQAWPQMTDYKRGVLGITVRDRIPTRRPVPTAMATLEILGVLRRKVTLLARNPEGGRARVAGAAGIQVFTHVGATVPAPGTKWTFHKNSGKMKFDVMFPDIVPDGASVFVAVAYFNAGGTGPLCPATQLNLPGGQAVYAREAS